MFLGFVALVLGCFVFGIALGIVDGIRGGKNSERNYMYRMSW